MSPSLHLSLLVFFMSVISVDSRIKEASSTVKSDSLSFDITRVPAWTHKYGDQNPSEGENSVSVVSNYRVRVDDQVVTHSKEGFLWRIVEGLYQFVDLSVISALVDRLIETLFPRIESFIDSWKEEDVESVGQVEETGQVYEWETKIRVILTFFTAGLLRKQDCLRRAVCSLGDLFQVMPMKSFVFMMLDRSLPHHWNTVRQMLELIKQGGKQLEQCEKYHCQDTTLH